MSHTRNAIERCKKHLSDLVDGIVAMGDILNNDLSARITEATTALQSITTEGANIINQANTKLTEKEFKATVGGTNAGLSLNEWIKVVQITPTDFIQIKQISITSQKPITNPDVDPENVAVFYKIKEPSTYVPVDVTDFDEIGQDPMGRIMSVNALDTYNDTYGTNAKFCEAASHPHGVTSLGATYPDTNFIGPHSESKNITMNYRLSSRGFQLWFWFTIAVELTVSIQYMATDETVENEA